MALTPITLTNLPGSDRRFNVPLNAGPTPYVTRSWEADTIDEDIRHSGLGGAVSVIKRRKRKTLTLKNMIVSRATRRLIEDLVDSRDPICVNPPWVDGTDTLTYLPLQKTLSDMLAEKVRSEIAFERYSSRFNSVTGRRTAFGEPHYEDAPFGSGIHISDVINDSHAPSYELRSYLTQDAEDSGATTLIYVSPAQAVLWDNYGSAVWPAGNKAFLMISNEEESSNAHELALISAINTTTGLVTLTSTDGTAALSNTANYTYAKRTYISSNLVSDGEMEDSGVGSWADTETPTLKEKSNTMQETGTRCIHIVGDGANDGLKQELGDIPANSNIVVWIRTKTITGTVRYQITNDAGMITYEDVASTEWTWLKNCCDVGGAGQETITIYVYCADAAAEFLVDRVYIFQNCVAGGMEPASGDTYDMELAVVTTSAAATTTYVGNVVTDAAAWDLSNAKVGHIAKDETVGCYGRINTVNDAGDSVTVDAWVGGAPANGNACGVYNAVAPGWDQDDCLAGDYLTQDTDEHGGNYAQQCIVNATGKGIISAAVACADDHWFFVGSYLKIAGGSNDVDLRAGTDLTVTATAAGAAAWTFFSGVALMKANRHIFFNSNGGAASWLCDDVMAIRLPGNPYDDAYYDLPEPVNNVDGFTGFLTWRPYFTQGDLDGGDAEIFRMNQRTPIANARMALLYDNDAAIVWFTSDGVIDTSFITIAVATGDNFYIGFRSKPTETKIYVKRNTDATQTHALASGGLAAGITRAWFHDPDTQEEATRGATSNVLLVNEELTDAQVEAIIDAFSGADADRLALLEETHGVLYEIRRGGVKVRGPAKGDEFRADIVLTELDRIGSISRQDA